MQKILTHLWFDKEAKDAINFYTNTFADSKLNHITTISGTPSGDADILSFTLSGIEFMAINAGPYFVINPSISFLVSCSTKEEVDQLWSSLSSGGTPLMELGSYPFSERYGWICDKYKVSWQIMYVGNEPIRQKIVPAMLFVGNVCGRAEESLNFYTTLFKNSQLDLIVRYEKSEGPDAEGTVMYGSFKLENQWFSAMDSAYSHEFAFNEAISFVVQCENQKEVDYYWEKLSAVPEAEQCGWLKDKFGVSWQIVPVQMNQMMKTGTKEQIQRVTEAFLSMKKFDIEKLERAFRL